ncbi:hypothetical protein HDV03_002122 [Kappamyces sp. JEL0829]|nr:hypothetical protein HDV03_002122 [Kappamyces sp. JEL0829]
MNTLQQPTIFDLVWDVFERNQQREGFQDLAQSSSSEIGAILQEFDTNQVLQLVQQTSQLIALENKSSIHFALLLSFKRIVIDAILQIYPLASLQSLVPSLHPMECVYMILNSLPADETPQAWLGNLGKAYSIFEYIVRWINWKVDGEQGDECYYLTYFHDYSRDERKRVMTSVGRDMLAYLEANPTDDIVDTVVKSANEIVPLLDPDHLPLFWKFFQKVALFHKSSLSIFFNSLSNSQKLSLLTQHSPSVSPQRQSSIGSAVGDAVTPIKRSLSISGKMREDAAELAHSLLQEISRRYSSSTEAGDVFLGEATALLSLGSNPSAGTEQPLSMNAAEPKGLVTRLTLVDDEPIPSLVTNLLGSKGLATTADRLMALQTCLWQWSLLTSETDLQRATAVWTAVRDSPRLAELVGRASRDVLASLIQDVRRLPHSLHNRLLMFACE